MIWPSLFLDASYVPVYVHMFIHSCVYCKLGKLLFLLYANWLELVHFPFGRDIMPIFSNPDAVTSLVDLMVAYIEVSFPDVEVFAGI